MSFPAPLSLAPQNCGDADAAYTSATSTLGSAHSSRSTAETAKRALKRMFTGKRDCMDEGACVRVSIDEDAGAAGHTRS